MESNIKIKGNTHEINTVQEIDRLRNTPVYKQTAEYAREHDELPVYRESNKVNIACKKAIEDAIHSNYANNCLNTKAVSEQIKEQFGAERMSYVLANTVQVKDWDGRISDKNKAWAKTVPVCQEKDAWGGNRNAYFAVDQAHPGLVDLLVTHVRKELAAEKAVPEKRASVLEKLHKNAATIPQTKSPVSKTKEPEL